MEATTNNSTESLLPSRAFYICSLFCIGDKLRNFRSCLKWMCVDQSNAKHVIISWSLFLLGIFIPTVLHFLSYALTHHVYDVVV
ncbi:hypothetical protein GW17_00017859 [Ensete ventricosum]|nr:hypothetical protein GW17_00017859 [Ensete ventricosum]